MNKKIHVISFVLIWFILNIFFFMFSENYRYFLESLKYDENKEYKVNDRFNISVNDLSENTNNIKDIERNIFDWLSTDFWKKVDVESNKHIENIIIWKDNVQVKPDWNNLNVNIDSNSNVEFLNSRDEIKLTDIEKQILEKFSKFELKEVDLHPRLFGLTWEYPEKYFEYYNEDINLYFFWNKLYSDIKDMFDVLTYELPISLKEVNNFGTKSFYINLNSWFDDGYIRVILETSNRLIGIKIKEELYIENKVSLYDTFIK